MHTSNYIICLIIIYIYIYNIIYLPWTQELLEFEANLANELEPIVWCSLFHASIGVGDSCSWRYKVGPFVERFSDPKWIKMVSWAYSEGQTGIWWTICGLSTGVSCFFPPTFHRSVFEQEKWTAKEKRYFNRQKWVMDRNVTPKCPKTLHLEQWIAIRHMKPYETSWSHGCKLWVPQHALDPAAVCKFGGPWTHRLHNLPGRNGDIRPKWQFD